MKRSIIAGMVIAAFCLGMIACGHFKSQPAKWEYKWQYLNVPSEEAKLQQLGTDGWELVSIAEIGPPAQHGIDAFYVFKRPVAP